MMQEKKEQIVNKYNSQACFCADRVGKNVGHILYWRGYSGS